MELSSQASFSDAHEILQLPLIAANLHRVIRPEQSQIWSVMRKDDTDARIFYSMCATFLGRMGLSGDIYDLSDHQWELVDSAIAYYHKAASIIQRGETTCLAADTISYNEPTGGQLVIRTFERKTLVVYHRFKDSVSITAFAEANGIELDLGDPIDSYGCADHDFSAESYILEAT